MTTVEYLSLSKPQRILVRIGSFFKNIPIAIWNFLKKIPVWVWTLIKKIVITPFVDVKNALLFGDWKVRLSFIICGFGQMTRHQVAKGILLFLYEAFFIAFMILVGAPNLSLLGSLGYTGLVSIGTSENYVGDNSLTIMLYSIITIILIIVMFAFWLSSIRAAKKLQDLERVGQYDSFKNFVRSLTGENYHIFLLSIPTLGLMVFTIIPIIVMILIGFTNYNTYHEVPSNVFEWVGFYNYSNIFTNNDASSSLFLQTFLQVLLWTLIWAFFATFSNYFLGMIVALIINQKTIKFKRLWRTILVTTIAVPQFVSLLLISRMFNQDMGFVNSFLIELGWIKEGIRWLNDSQYVSLLPKVMIIIINTWVGIPYTMLLCTGILMNIPDDLYESAKIDGASPFKMYMKITLPYMLFVTGPYLISQFVGNINNFNVIYLLSQGNPLFTYGDQAAPSTLQGVGQTDLLITWIYKISVTNNPKEFGLASVLGVMIFVIVAFFSLITYSRSNAVKNEGDFN